MQPNEVKTYADIGELKQDGIDSGNTWVCFIHLDEIIICNQKFGEPATGIVYLTRCQMQRVCD